MKILVLGNMSDQMKRLGLELVQRPEDADYVIADKKQTFFLGSKIGEVFFRAQELEFTMGSPKVLSEQEFLRVINTLSRSVSL